MNPYEREREERIARNNKKMQVCQRYSRPALAGLQEKPVAEHRQPALASVLRPGADCRTDTQAPPESERLL